MATVYAVKDWAERFTVSQATRVKGNLSWVAVPINLTGETYRVMMQTEAGQRAYAAFIALVCVAANCPIRGVLADRNGQAMTIRSLSFKTGIPEDRLNDDIWYLCSEQIGWLVVVQLGALSTPSDIHSERSLLGAREEKRREEKIPPKPPQGGALEKSANGRQRRQRPLTPEQAVRASRGESV